MGGRDERDVKTDVGDVRGKKKNLKFSKTEKRREIRKGKKEEMKET